MSLTATATKSTTYMATYFRIWGAGSVILALVLPQFKAFKRVPAAFRRKDDADKPMTAGVK